MVHNWQFEIAHQNNSPYCSIVYMNIIDPFYIANLDPLCRKCMEKLKI